MVSSLFHIFVIYLKDIRMIFQSNAVKNIQLSEQLFLKPEYAIHSEVSGNKFRKLKYNIEQFLNSDFDRILTFGGAFSNHIAATAAAGKALNVPTIGIIRGEELENPKNFNPTLHYAKTCGMELKFIPREVYRKINTPEFLRELNRLYPKSYILPEGGTNSLAVKGCEEILSHKDKEFDVICCAVGTGGTISGLINSSLLSQKIIGFPALKGAFLNQDIRKFASKSNWELCHEYHFGGYAKVNSKLVDFMNTFKKKFEISLDPIYTGKMMYGLFDLIEKGFFSKTTKILAIHTGGLQSISGMNQRLKQKKLELII